MRVLLDPGNEELTSILTALLTENVEVTFREVARRHSCLKNPSAFTRNKTRVDLIAAAQVQQQSIRRIAVSGADEKVQAAPKPDEAQAKIKRLESQLALLAAAHAGLIRSVQLAGGMAALERFWKDYKSICDAVHAHSGVPSASNVVQLATAPRDA